MTGTRTCPRLPTLLTRAPVIVPRTRRPGPCLPEQPEAGSLYAGTSFSGTWDSLGQAGKHESFGEDSPTEVSQVQGLVNAVHT